MNKKSVETVGKNETYNLISPVMSAINNEARFSILEILLDVESSNQTNVIQKEPLYSREINCILFKKYNIKISPQMLGKHLKQLENADLVEEVDIKKEVPNKIGPRSVKAYKIKHSAFKDLFLEINLFTSELLRLFEAYQKNQNLKEDKHLILTVLNGKNRGETYKINGEEIRYLCRKSRYNLRLDSEFITLDRTYSEVNDESSPHLKIYCQEDTWYVLDESSENGTYINDRKVVKEKATPLTNNSFLRLSRGSGSVVLFCSYD